MTSFARRHARASLNGAIALIISALSLSCSEDATEANAIVSPVALRNFVFQETVVYADTTAQFMRHIPMGGPVNLAGRATGCTAKTLLQFTPAYLPHRDTVSVLQATLWLKSVSWFGDSTATCSFKVYRINASWNPSTVTWDSIGSGFADGPGSERGSLTISPGPDSQWVSISLDTAMVRVWLSSSTSADSSKFGIILVPTQGTGNIIRGFGQFSSDTSLTPRLTIIARGPNTSTPDTNSYSTGFGTFVGNLDSPVADPSQLYVQSGIVRRVVLHFNVSAIPKGAFVSKANLLMNLSTGASILNRFAGSHSVIAHLLSSPTDTTIYDTYRYTTGGIKSGDTMSTDMRYIVQTWIKGPNYGAVISTTSSADYLSGKNSEHSSLDLYVFSGITPATPLSRRPRIHIIYALGQ